MIKSTNKINKNILTNPCKYANKITIDELVEILEYLSDSYYNDEGLVSDEIYDILRDILETRDPDNPFLKKIGAPVSKEISKDKVKLPYFMASLDKIKPDTGALESWLRKYEGPYLLSEKLDGVSGLLVKDNNNYNLYTRGDGSKGQNITYLIPYVLSKKIKLNKIPNKAAIRGELIISKSDFAKIKDEFSNARNTVSGVVNAKSFSKKLAKMTTFIGYSVINPKYKFIEQMKMLESWNFPVVDYKVKDNLTNDYLSEYLHERRKNSLYEIDGIVVMDSSKKYGLPCKNPPYGFAFKTIMTDQIAEAIVTDVEWTASMHGFIKPRVKINPIKIGNVEINYATAHNAKYVVDNVLGPGAVIKLIRSGDVIPYIMEVLKPAANNKPKMPSIPYKWNDTKVDLIVKDIHGASKDNIMIKKMVHFFLRKCTTFSWNL